MNHKKWSVDELQNLLSMIMSGFKVTDMMQAFKCSEKQIRNAVKVNFDSSIRYIRMKYKIEVIK
tara:strand:+ start:638 stop:829 length:192 start_codon:yes stop_codon:yes gene_type:complete